MNEVTRQQIEAKVKGMHCAACSSRIERVVGDMAGVTKVSVNLATETISLAFNDEETTLAQIAAAIADLGFELQEEEEALRQLELAIGGMHCAACSARIERVVGGMAGVASCRVNLAAESCQLSFNPRQVTLRQIKEAISGLGFSASLAATTSQADLTAREAERRSALLAMRRRLLPSFILAMLIMVLSMGEMVGLRLPTAIAPDQNPLAFATLQFILVLPVLWLGRSFYRLGIPALLRRVPTMDSLIAVGTGAAFVYSSWNLVEIYLGLDPLARAHDLYFESAAMLIALVSLGKYLEARAKARTSEAISQLMELAPEEAILLTKGGQEKILVADILAGDRILVRPGERIPVDGVVQDGSSRVDESMLTGESKAARKGVGDPLFSGTLNGHGALTLRAEQVGQDTMLARIIKLVQQAQGSKAPIANLADRISLYFVPTVMIIAAVAGLSWYFIGGAQFSFALRIFIAVLVIACPCAMGLATPTSIMVGTGRGAQLGVLIKNGEVLQKAGGVDTMVFDKTGTLTHGKPRLSDFLPQGGGMGRSELLALVAGAEASSEHPLAEAIVRSVTEEGIEFAEVREFVALPGQGIRARMAGDRPLLLGNKQLMEEEQIDGLSSASLARADELAGQGKTALFLAVNGALQAILGVADTVKDESAATIKSLQTMGIEVIMLTGDNEQTARTIGEQIGIDQVLAQILPADKEREVARLQEEKGRVVAMVGDGINDAPALARADVGIAMGTGIDVAIESGDMVLMAGKLDGVITAISLSRATMTNIKQNLFWAFAYNVVGIPVAAGLLYIFGGPTLNPMIGGAAMALSSVSVVSNALRLRFFNV
ncbi:MAG: heavy metal translocating P-type ATPase [Thermodesulfobacteriota bacterium]